MDKKGHLDKEKLQRGLEKAYQKMIEFKRKMNSELVVMKEGKIVKIKP